MIKKYKIIIPLFLTGAIVTGITIPIVLIQAKTPKNKLNNNNLTFDINSLQSDDKQKASNAIKNLKYNTFNSQYGVKVLLPTISGINNLSFEFISASANDIKGEIIYKYKLKNGRTLSLEKTIVLSGFLNDEKYNKILTKLNNNNLTFDINSLQSDDKQKASNAIKNLKYNTFNSQDGVKVLLPTISGINNLSFEFINASANDIKGEITYKYKLKNWQILSLEKTIVLSGFLNDEKYNKILTKLNNVSSNKLPLSTIGYKTKLPSDAINEEIYKISGSNPIKIIIPPTSFPGIIISRISHKFISLKANDVQGKIVYKYKLIYKYFLQDITSKEKTIELSGFMTSQENGILVKLNNHDSSTIIGKADNTLLAYIAAVHPKYRNFNGQNGIRLQIGNVSDLIGVRYEFQSLKSDTIEGKITYYYFLIKDQIKSKLKQITLSGFKKV